MDTCRKKTIRIPTYTLGEELFNAISHGLGAGLSVSALTLMAVKARGALAETTVCLFGASLVALYAASCLYHALPPRLAGKKMLRVLDHCNVFLLVGGTYAPVALLGVGGPLGLSLAGLVLGASVLGVVLTAVDIDRFVVPSVLAELVSGWSILLGLSALRASLGAAGLHWLTWGGLAYSLGALLYGLGARRKGFHGVFHIFCLMGSFCHFWCVYRYLL